MFEIMGAGIRLKIDIPTVQKQELRCEAAGSASGAPRSIDDDHEKSARGRACV